MKFIPALPFSWRWLLIVHLLFFGTQPILSAQEISVSPARIFFKESEPQRLSQRVTLHNSGSKSIIFQSSISDWKRDSLGNKLYFPPGTLSSSNASWVEVQPNIVEIPAHSKREVTVILHVPKDKKPSLTHSMLFLSQLNAQPSGEITKGKTNIGVMVKLEFGIHVYYTPLLTELKNLEFMNLTEKTVTADNKKIRRIEVKVKNTGNVMTDGFLRLEVTEKSSGKEMKLPEKAVSMLPGDEQTIYLDMPASLTGAYLVVALLDSGEQTNLKVAKKDVVFN